MLFIVVIFLVVSQAGCQQCSEFNAAGAPASGDICQPYVSYQIWLPPVPNAIFFVDSIFNSSFLWKIKAVQPIVSFSCYNALLSLSCATAFPYCINGTSYPPCRSLCTHVDEICYDFFASFQQPALNCSQKDQFTNLDMWPQDEYPCIAELHTPKLAPPTVTCPYPLTLVEHVDDVKSPCEIPCPDPFWTSKEWDDIAIMDFVLAIISFLLMFFMSLHYILDPKCRKTTRRFQLYSYLSQLLFAMSFVIGGPSPQKSTWCKDRTTWGDVTLPGCGAQAFFFVVFSLSAATWWAISSSVMYMQLERQNYTISKRRELLYWFIALGVPVIMFIIAARQNAVTFYWGTPSCFIQNKIPNTSIEYHYVLFYTPLSIAFLFAAGFVLATLYKIVKHSCNMKATFKGQEHSSGISLFKLNVRLFIWCVFILLMFLMILMYRFVPRSEWEAAKVAAFEWSICKVTSELGLGPNDKCPEATFPRPLNYGGGFAHNFIISLHGILSFLPFGTTMKLFYFWRQFFRMLRAGEWDELRDLITNESASETKTRERRSKINIQKHSSGDSGTELMEAVRES